MEWYLVNACPPGAAGIVSSGRWPVVRGQKRLVSGPWSKGEGAGDARNAQNEANLLGVLIAGGL